MLAALASAPSAEGQWSIGGGGVGATGICVGKGDSVGFEPIFSYETEKLHIGLDGVSDQVFDYGLGQVDVSLGYRGAPAFPDKVPLYEGLKREGAIEMAFANVTAAYQITDAITAVG